MSPTRHLPFFFTDRISENADQVVIDRAEARHLSVRRASLGDMVQVSDGRGTVVEAKIVHIADRGVTADIVGRRREPSPPATVTVFQALAKSGKIDWAVEKMVELGVDEIAVFFADRSVPVWDDTKRSRVLARWQRVAKAAAKQSHRARLPQLRGPLSEDEILGEIRKLDCVVVGDPGSDVRLDRALGDEPGARIGVIVGPEGGFGDAELASFKAAGGRPVGLGPQVLRTETAGLVMCTLVLHHLGRLG